MADQLGVELTFDQAGVRWLDEYINGNCDSWSGEQVDGLASTLGSFLGECIIQSFGGCWADIDGQIGTSASACRAGCIIGPPPDKE